MCIIYDYDVDLFEIWIFVMSDGCVEIFIEYIRNKVC